MSGRRKHRGPHPEDPQLFTAETLGALQVATAELSWLWSRGYAPQSSLKLVGDRHALNSRQRLAVGRCACGDAAPARRRRHEYDEDSDRVVATSDSRILDRAGHWFNLVRRVIAAGVPNAWCLDLATDCLP